MKRWKVVQLVAVITLFVLFIKYIAISTNITNDDHLKTSQSVQSAVTRVETLSTQYSNYIEQYTAKDENTKGFVISSSFYEQQIGAALNLWTLSKWATTIGVYPVEPFVIDSKFELPKSLSHSASPDVLRFRDYFDLKLWNDLCSDLKLMPLISWEAFLHTKSNLVIVAVVLLESDQKRDLDCTKRLQKFLNSISGFSKEVNFTIVKKVCFVFSGKNSVSVRDFNAKLYGDFNPKQVTVWFSVWPGVNSYRIYFKEMQYWRNSQSMYSIHPSKRIITDSQKYVHNYMGSEFGQYVAVSFRSVKRAKQFQLGGISQEIRAKFFNTCIKELGEKLESLGSSSKRFLSIDLGKFGDSSATKYMESNLIDKVFNSAIGIVYNNKTTIEDYEKSFSNVTNGIEDNGYMAAVQRTIVENSNCLVLFGGNSNFQRSILINYVENHRTPCVVKVCYIS